MTTMKYGKYRYACNAFPEAGCTAIAAAAKTALTTPTLDNNLDQVYYSFKTEFGWRHISLSYIVPHAHHSDTLQTWAALAANLTWPLWASLGAV